jgi:hypothetical protein
MIGAVAIARILSPIATHERQYWPPHVTSCCAVSERKLTVCLVEARSAGHDFQSCRKDRKEAGLQALLIKRPSDFVCAPFIAALLFSISTCFTGCNQDILYSS